VLVAGSGAYRHLKGYQGAPGEIVTPAPNAYGMGQLTSTPRAAEKLVRWLLNPANQLQVPLATCRVLLSPAKMSSAVIAPDPQPAGFHDVLVDRCSRANFKQEADAWREAASRSPDDIAIFYFAGHGVQRSKGDSVMLMDDFGSDETLGNTASSRNLYDGMANSDARPDIARTQLFFVDACRVMPKEFTNFERMSVPDLWNIELAGTDFRRAPIFYAARSGQGGAGIRDVGTIFSEALVNCLEGGAAQLDDTNGQADWRISIYSLTQAMRAKVSQLNAVHRGNQEFTVDGDSGDTVLRRFAAAPRVPVTVQIVPPAGRDYAAVVVTDENRVDALALPKPLNPHPYTAELLGGYYHLGARINPPCDPYVDFPTKLVKVQPPFVNWQVKVVR
jgi:hypothetical protein